MDIMTRFSDITRSPGDPKVLAKGTSSLGSADQLARALGWFSIGLGLTQLLAPRLLTETLGMQGKEMLVRACGAREIATGVMALSINPRPGIASRVAGDTMDIATLAFARRSDNPKRRNVDLALAAVVGVAILDIVCHQGLRARHARPRSSTWRDYSDRTGLPRGIEASRGLARQGTDGSSDQRGSAERAYEPEPFRGA
jgi:hypothetical protein